MTYRDDFFGNTLQSSGPLRISYGQNVLINTTDRGLADISGQVKDTNRYLQSVQSALLESAERNRESNEESAQLLAAEIAHQTDKMMRGFSSLSLDVMQASEEVTQAIGHLGAYLGAGLSEVRWAIDRNTAFTRKILEVQLNSHWNDSRQFFEAGVHWYEKRQLELAAEDFQKAVGASSTNAFAYQYLGFLAVHRDDGTQAKRYFELAAECAPGDHHRALALYHLARALHAGGDDSGALEKIRESVKLEAENLVYRYELVHSLVWTGGEDEAISELRKVISADLAYWTATEIDKSLDPIRAKVNQLRNKMREELGQTARVLISQFAETIDLTAGFNDPSLAASIITARAACEALQRLCERGTVFAYEEVAKTAPEADEHLIQEVIRIYRERISHFQDSILQREAEQREEIDGHKNKLAELKRIYAELLQRREAASAEANTKEDELQRTFASENEMKAGEGGCLGCLGLLGAWLLVPLGFNLLHPSKMHNYFLWIIVVALLCFLCYYLLAALPHWFIKKRRARKKLEQDIAANREQVSKETLRLIEKSQDVKMQTHEFERKASEIEAASEEEVREMKTDLEQSHSLCLQRINALRNRPGHQRPGQIFLLESEVLFRKA